MAQEYDMDILNPRAALVTVDDPEVVWDEWVEDDDRYDITGNYNISDIPFINPGISTAIVTIYPNNNYWAAWCDRIEMEPPPDVVWAKFGYAGPD